MCILLCVPPKGLCFTSYMLGPSVFLQLLTRINLVPLAGSSRFWLLLPLSFLHLLTTYTFFYKYLKPFLAIKSSSGALPLTSKMYSGQSPILLHFSTCLYSFFQDYKVSEVRSQGLCFYFSPKSLHCLLPCLRSLPKCHLFTEGLQKTMLHSLTFINTFTSFFISLHNVNSMMALTWLDYYYIPSPRNIPGMQQAFELVNWPSQMWMGIIQSFECQKPKVREYTN